MKFVFPKSQNYCFSIWEYIIIFVHKCLYRYKIPTGHPQKQPFADVLQICVLKNISNFNGISFLIKLQALGLQHYLKKAPAQVFLRILRNFSEQLFYETPLVAPSSTGVIQMWSRNYSECLQMQHNNNVIST